MLVDSRAWKAVRWQSRHSLGCSGTRIQGQLLIIRDEKHHLHPRNAPRLDPVYHFETLPFHALTWGRRKQQDLPHSALYSANHHNNR